jgi:hypothetical protein
MKRRSFFKGIPKGDWAQWKTIRQQVYRDIKKMGIKRKKALRLTRKRMKYLKKMSYKRGKR